MDYGTYQGVYTLVLMAIFIGIIVWAYSKKRKTSFNEAANLVFADDEVHADSLQSKKGEQNASSVRVQE